jgi:hypothetical protein
MSESIQVPEKFQYLNPDQVQRMNSDIVSLRKQIEDPRPGGADKGEMLARVRRIEQSLETQKPPDLTAEQRDAYAKEEERLRETFAPHMLSGEEMRKAPPGAVDRQIAFHEKFKRVIFRWKNIIRALNPDNTAPDLSSIERFRPHKRPGQPSMHDVQIEGKTFVGLEDSPAYREGWDRTFGDEVDTMNEMQRMREELAAMREMLTQKPKPKPKKERPPKPPAVMACGKELKDNRGRLFHERQCKDCQEAKAREEASLST